MNRGRRAVSLSPPNAEYIYYALIVYGIFAPAWGISVPLFGAGAGAVFALYCILKLQRDAGSVYKPLSLPLWCAISFITIQVVFHHQSIMAEDNRQMVNWIFALISVQSLLLRRGFFHRFAIAAAIIGVLLLRYLNLDYVNAGDLERAGLDTGVGFANPNDLAAWFGFCCLYFAVVAIETRRTIVRTCAALAGLGFLYFVGLTVSRGTLMAVGISGVVALRHPLKRGFIPLLLLTVAATGIFYSGVFDREIGLYVTRGTEDTGRLTAWPVMIKRIIDAPLVGVGADEVLTYIPEDGHETSPHNAFIYIALAAGAFPFMLFVGYWVKAAWGAHEQSRIGMRDGPFQLPLLIYTFINACLGVGVFMYPWAIVTLCHVMEQRSRRPLTDQIAGRRTVVRSQGRHKRTYGVVSRRISTFH